MANKKGTYEVIYQADLMVWDNKGKNVLDKLNTSEKAELKRKIKNGYTEGKLGKYTYEIDQTWAVDEISFDGSNSRPAFHKEYESVESNVLEDDPLFNLPGFDRDTFVEHLVEYGGKTGYHKGEFDPDNPPYFLKYTQAYDDLQKHLSSRTPKMTSSFKLPSNAALNRRAFK